MKFGGIQFVPGDEEEQPPQRPTLLGGPQQPRLAREHLPFLSQQLSGPPGQTNPK